MIANHRFSYDGVYVELSDRDTVLGLRIHEGGAYCQDVYLPRRRMAWLLLRLLWWTVIG